MTYAWLIPLVALLALAGGAIYAAQRPGFWIDMVKTLVVAALPSIKDAFKPKDYSKEQLQAIREAQDPNKVKPKGVSVIKGLTPSKERLNK